MPGGVVMLTPALIFVYRPRCGSLLADTGQIGALARSATATATDHLGTSVTLAQHQPALEALDLDGDTVRERLALKLRSTGNEAATWPLLAPPQVMTLYVRFVERTALATANPLVALGTVAGGARWTLGRASSGAYTATHHNGSTNTTAAASATPTLNALHELRVVLRATGQIQTYQSIAEAAETAGSASGASPVLAAAWGALTLAVNTDTNGNYGGMDLLTLALLQGEVPLATCRQVR